MRLTLKALGLRHHQAEVIQQDSPALRGQLKRVRHLVEVTPVSDSGEAKSKDAGRSAATPRKKVREK